MDISIGKLTDQPKWNYNPYVRTNKRSVVLQKEHGSKIISSGGGDFDPYKDIHGMARIREVDNERFVKIYTSNLSMWFELSIPSQKMMQYILSILPRNSDVVVLEFERVKAYTEYKSFSSIYNAINELINKRIIARTKIKDAFFINPSFIFNGDRVIFSEAIVRSPQAIHERNSIEQNIIADPNYSDEMGRALEPETVTTSEETLFDRASKLYD